MTPIARMYSLVAILLATSFITTVAAQEMPADYQQVLSDLGRHGDFKDKVLKVNIPRNDLQVTVKGIATPTPFGFGGWVAMTKDNGGTEVMMGDLVLLEDEVNPTMSAILENNLEVTALHNHLFWEQPRVFYMHIHGRGTAVELARKLKPALRLIGKQVSPTAASKGQNQPATDKPQASLDAERLARIVGHQGEWNGPVYKITIGRSDFEMKEHGAVINARMGLNTWAAFVGTNENAAVAGDVAMLEHEVTPVLKALRKNGLDVVAIHHHMTETRPVVIFLHYWGTGPAEKLAAGFRSALDQLGKGATRGIRRKSNPTSLRSSWPLPRIDEQPPRSRDSFGCLENISP